MATSPRASAFAQQPAGSAGRLLLAARASAIGPARERGVALLVALILLVVITLVGLAAIGTTILQNKAAANQYDRQVAFQSTEAALAQAQAFITTNANPGNPLPAGIEDCSTPTGVGGAPTNACGANPFNDPSNTGITIQAATNVGTGAGGAAAAGTPQYVVQYMGKYVAPTPKARQIGGQQPYGAGARNLSTDYYRITARSADPTTATGRAIVTLQSTFRN